MFLTKLGLSDLRFECVDYWYTGLVKISEQNNNDVTFLKTKFCFRTNFFHHASRSETKSVNWNYSCAHTTVESFITILVFHRSRMSQRIQRDIFNCLTHSPEVVFSPVTLKPTQTRFPTVCLRSSVLRLMNGTQQNVPVCNRITAKLGLLRLPLPHISSIITLLSKYSTSVECVYVQVSGDSIFP